MLISISGTSTLRGVMGFVYYCRIVLIVMTLCRRSTRWPTSAWGYSSSTWITKHHHTHLQRFLQSLQTINLVLFDLRWCTISCMLPVAHIYWLLIISLSGYSQDFPIKHSFERRAALLSHIPYTVTVGWLGLISRERTATSWESSLLQASKS